MKILISAFLGVLSWPILEYVLHRYVGHVWKLNTLFKKEHSRHHREVHYFAPLTYKVLASIPILGVLFSIVGGITASWQIGLGYSVGFIAMFSVYEWFHWVCHARAPRTNLGLRLRKHHLGHHFHNAQMNHGVTSTWIDRVTGTYLEIPVIRVPKAFPLPWLLNADQSGIAEQYAKDFQFK